MYRTAGTLPNYLPQKESRVNAYVVVQKQAVQVKQDVQAISHLMCRLKMLNPCPKPQHRSKSHKASPIPEKIRQQVIDRDIYCQGCGKPGVHIHHIIFRSAGGKHTLNNLVYLCDVCHRMAHAYRKWREHWERWIQTKIKESVD